MSILNEARERFDFMNVWTDGFYIKITVMDKR